MPLNGPHDLNDNWTDYLPHATVGIYLMPWSWYWYRRPWVSLYEGCFGFAWLFLDLQVNWLSRRFWGSGPGTLGESRPDGP